MSEFHFRLLQDPAQDSAPDSHKARKGMSKTHTFKSGNNEFCLETTPTPHAVPTTNDCRWTEKPDLAKSTHQPSDFNVEPGLHLKHIGITYVWNIAPPPPRPPIPSSPQLQCWISYTSKTYYGSVVYLYLKWGRIIQTRSQHWSLGREAGGGR